MHLTDFACVEKLDQSFQTFAMKTREGNGHSHESLSTVILKYLGQHWTEGQNALE